MIRMLLAQGWVDIGSIEAGKCADLAVWRSDRHEFGAAARAHRKQARRFSDAGRPERARLRR